MQPQYEHLTETADAILSYLHSHPDATDTVEGISQWWLPAEYCADTQTVISALARLESQGLIHRRINADRHELYYR